MKIERVCSGVVKCSSEHEGKNILVLGGVHGDELCGVFAIRRLLQEFNEEILSLKNGSVTFAYGNLDAIVAKRRFIDVDLNRTFSEKAILDDTLEAGRAFDLMPFFHKMDVVLDIHATAVVSEDFIIAQGSCVELARALSPTYVVSGWNKFSSVSGDAAGYANRVGAIGLTYEAGQINTQGSKRRAYDMILKLLHVTDMLDAKVTFVPFVDCFELQHVIYKSSDELRWKFPISNFDEFAKYDLLLEYDDLQIRAPYDCFLVLPKAVESVRIGGELGFLALQK